VGRFDLQKARVAITIRPVVSSKKQYKNRLFLSFSLFAAVPCYALSAASAPVDEPGGVTRASQERAARKACMTGDVAKGIGILADLFLDTKNITYVFNQGRCYEQNRQYEDAIGRFEEYLRVTALQPAHAGDRAIAEQHLADCKRILAEGAEPASIGTPPPPVTPTEHTEPTPPETTSAPPETGIDRRAEPAVTRAGAGLRTAGIISGAIGGGALVAGIVFNLKANGLADDLNAVDGYSDDKNADRKAYKTVAWVGYGVATVGIAAGAALYLLGVQAGRDGAGDLALLPVASKSGMGLCLTGAF
jgi:hypothetical protein